MTRPRKVPIAALLLPVIGCGATPDFILEELRDSAKEAFEQQVDQMVDDLMQGFLEDVELPIGLLGDEEALDDEENLDDQEAADDEGSDRDLR